MIEFGTGAALSPAQLHELYKDTEVPQHRYLLPEAATLLTNPVALSAAAATPDFELIPSLKGVVNVGSLVGAIKDPQGNENYEQLAVSASIPPRPIWSPRWRSSCRMVTRATSAPAAARSMWRSGPTGSRLYVGTTSVNVHDIAAIPAGGLQYAAVLPFPEALTSGSRAPTGRWSCRSGRCCRGRRHRQTSTHTQFRCGAAICRETC